jgi:hypothetical protein
MKQFENDRCSAALPSPSADIEESIWRRAVKFRRFYRMRPAPFSTSSLNRPLIGALDRKLTADPENGQQAPQHNMPERQELSARHKREYAIATREFSQDDPAIVAAWIARTKHRTLWLTSPEYQQAKRNCLLASFVGIFVSTTGLYPTKVSMIGVEFDNASRIGLCSTMIILILYLWASANTHESPHLI